MTKVITRFAPSPTGFLHIGGARTALFNYLFAKHHQGKFLLRIEDTDRARSTDETVEAILMGMKWLNLNWDEDAVSQFSRAPRHREVALELLEKGHAYYCYATPEELSEMREAAKKEGRQQKYDGRWRDRDPAEAPEGISPAIRLKAPQTGSSTINDLVQGSVTIEHEQLDDMVLLRSDGTPTYMLAVVVDDHDMDITHVIRGDDHLNNAFRQLQIYKAMGWHIPEFAHIPLIHGPDGAKLSKRHGALGIEAYQEMGYLPEAINNYLMRLGWSHGDDEIIEIENAIKWFSLENVGKSPSRFDFDKLRHVNQHYMAKKDPKDLIPLLKPYFNSEISPQISSRLERGLESLLQRSETLEELAKKSQFYLYESNIPLEEKAAEKFLDGGKEKITDILPFLEAIKKWSEENIKEAIQAYCKKEDIKLGKVGPFIRIALTGSIESPSIFQIMDILGQEETLNRLRTQTL